MMRLANSRNIAVRCTKVVSSACLNAGCGLTWAVLLISAVTMLVIHFRHDVSVPDFLVRRLQTRLKAVQLRAELGATSLDPTGVLVAENIRVFGEGSTDPLAEARAIRLRFNPWLLAVGYFDVAEVVVDGGRLNCPAMFSPSGNVEPLIEDLRCAVVHGSNRWSVPALSFRSRNLRFHGAGEVSERRRSGDTPLPQDLLARYFALCRQLGASLGELDRAQVARLEFEYRERAGATPELSLAAVMDRLQLPDGRELRGVRATARPFAVLASGDLQTVLDLECAELASGDGLLVSGLRARLPLRTAAWTELQFPLNAEVHAESVSLGSDRIAYPRANVRWDGRGALDFDVQTLVAHSPLSLAGRADLVSRRGEFSAHGRLAPEFLNDGMRRLAEWRRSRILSKISFAAPVSVAAEVRLAPGWVLDSAGATLAIAAADGYGVDLQDTRAELAMDRHSLSVQRIVLRHGSAEVRGSYTMDLASQDYRFLLTGKLFPEAINPWFSEWWPRLWRDFDFRGHQAETDVDVRGRWRSPHLSVVSGRMQASPLTLRGVALERADVSFFIRPEHYDIVHFDARRGDQFAVGSFTRRDDPFTHQPLRIDFDFVSKLPLKEGAVFFGPEGPSVVEPYVFATAPDVAARGRIDWRQGHSYDAITAAVSAPGEFRFNGFPVLNPRLSFDLKDNDIFVREFVADLADGKLRGEGTVTGPTGKRRLKFDGTLRAADLTRTVKTWNEFRASTGEVSATAHADSVAANLGTHGKLDLDLQATGPLDNLMGLRGQGRAAITGAELGDVQMLGFLSRQLQGSVFGFTSLHFTNADAVFTVEETDLKFSKLTFTGPSSRLEAKGRYIMPTEKLDFLVSLRPFRESDFALASLIGLVLQPIASVLEVKLGGTMAKPDWAFSVSPTSLFRPFDKPTPPPAPLVPVETPGPGSGTGAGIPPR